MEILNEEPDQNASSREQDDFFKTGVYLTEKPEFGHIHLGENSI